MSPNVSGFLRAGFVMSDAAVTALVSGLVTITTMVMGFLTLWVKLRYASQKAAEAAQKAHIVEGKIDHNTLIADRIEKQTNGGMDSKFDKHGERISDLETRAEVIKTAIDSLMDSLRSTRHEMRGHLQTIVNTMNTAGIRYVPLAVDPFQHKPTEQPKQEANTK